MGVQVWECLCVVSSCGAVQVPGVWVWGIQVSGYLSAGYLCTQQWGSNTLEYLSV